LEEINVYTTPTCPWCGKVKEYLQAKGVQYSEIDVAADASGARRLVELTGQRSVPVTVKKDQVVVGYDPEQLAKLIPELTTK